MSGPPYAFPGGVSATSIAAARLTALDANDLHAWELTEGSGATFVDGGSSATPVNLTINNATNLVLGTDGQVGACPLFDFSSSGGQGATVDASALVSAFADLPAAAFTLESWFRAWFDPASMHIAGVTTTTLTNVQLGLNGTNEVFFTLRTANNFNNISGSNVAIYRNTWHHTAVTYDGATAKLYLDGEVVNQQAMTGLVLWANGVTPKLCVGRDVPGGSGVSPFIGQLSRTRLSNIARSQAYLRGVFQKGALY